MIKIGIELNGVVRDINKQYLKYYLKDINPSFDDTNIDINVNNFITKLPFESKSSVEKFIYEDYPYEIFGCAAPMSRNLHTFINGWSYEMENEDYEIGFFSFNEKELSIQSTFFYLSKSGSRIRRVIFPKTLQDVFNEFDVIITTNDKLILSTPSNKKSILIEKNDNNSVLEFSKLHYKSLEDLMKDNDNFKMFVYSGFKPTFKMKVKKLIKKVKNFIWRKN